MHAKSLLLYIFIPLVFLKVVAKMSVVCALYFSSLNKTFIGKTVDVLTMCGDISVLECIIPFLCMIPVE